MREYKLKNILEQSKLDIHIETTTLNGGFEIHSHDFCELVFIVSGEGKHIVDDMEYDIKKGDIFILKGKEKHGFSSLKNLTLYNVMFKVSDLQIDDCKNLIGFWILFIHEQTTKFLSHMNVEGEDYQMVDQWCRLLLHEYLMREKGYMDICRSVLMQLIVFLSRKCQMSIENHNLTDFRLAKSIIYMQTDFSCEITVDQLASLVGFSKRHYARLFQQTYGISPIQFLNEIRINHAKMLLKNENYKIIDISAMCGFQDGNYFSKIFKKKTGYSPLEWRKAGLL